MNIYAAQLRLTGSPIKASCIACMYADGDLRFHCPGEGCKELYQNISSLRKHCTKTHPRAKILSCKRSSLIPTREVLDYQRTLLYEYQDGKWVQDSSQSLQLPCRKLPTGVEKRYLARTQAQDCKDRPQKQPPVELDSSNNTVCLADSLEVLNALAEAKDVLSTDSRGATGFCKQCSATLAIQVWKDKSGHALEGNAVCVYCHTADMTPVKFLSPQDIPEMRHFLTACNPCPVKYMSLHEVGHVLPSVQLEDSVDLGTALSIQQLLQGLDEDKLRRVRSVDGKGTGGAKGVVWAICQHLRKLDDYYFSCNLKLGPTDAHTPAVQLLDQIRCKFAAGEWWSAAAGARVTDIYTTSLILIGGCSTHTGSLRIGQRKTSGLCLLFGSFCTQRWHTQLTYGYATMATRMGSQRQERCILPQR